MEWCQCPPHTLLYTLCSPGCLQAANWAKKRSVTFSIPSPGRELGQILEKEGPSLQPTLENVATSACQWGRKPQYRNPICFLVCCEIRKTSWFFISPDAWGAQLLTYPCSRNGGCCKLARFGADSPASCLFPQDRQVSASPADFLWDLSFSMHSGVGLRPTPEAQTFVTQLILTLKLSEVSSWNHSSQS